LTYKELVIRYNSFIFNHPNPQSVKPLYQLIADKEVIKIKYQCINITEPQDLNYSSVCDLILTLAEVNPNKEFIQTYDSVINKGFYLFWDSNKALENEKFYDYTFNLNKDSNKIN
jgi:hypothetical protein